jgi:hypothetical protein
MDKVYCADVWFATAKEQKVIALAKGVDKNDIHTEGEGAEGWGSLLTSYRGKGGKLGLVGGLYILGQSSDTLKARLVVLRQKRIKPYDLESGERDGQILYADAMSSILGSKKFRGDKVHHRKASAKGGHGKGVAMAKIRDGIAAEWLLQNIARCHHLTWAQKLELLDGKISEATLRRLYL